MSVKQTNQLTTAHEGARAESMSSEDADYVTELVLEAGSELMRWRPGTANGGLALGIEEKSDGSLVSSADFAAQKVIFKGLGAQFPDESVLSEEGVLNECGSSSRSWIVDPLDGTHEFLAGTPDFAVQLACCLHGRSVAGWVYFPALQRLIAARDGAFATIDGRVCSVIDRGKLEPMRVLVRGSDGQDPRAQHPTIQTQVALRRLLVGELDAVIIRLGRLGVWDVAAWSVIVLCAGGVVCDEYGSAVSFGATVTPPRTVVFSVPGLKEEVVDIARALP